MEAGQEYARDLHMCVRCGITWKVTRLTKATFVKVVHRNDQVLNIPEDVYVCTDEEECARWKVKCDEHLALERERATPAMLAKRLAAEDRERELSPRPTTPGRRRR